LIEGQAGFVEFVLSHGSKFPIVNLMFEPQL